ncbi:hypothetical protein H5410_060922 [Solanum commersonii]|uniref:Uncharacterized protein n=1 Tax=Solanum commersonii TaxID=4109 RepID=A0A9J5W7F4_SOLCO|nr:hypothetical protein H5410_060922 [Solanum commersonii]
MNRAHVLYSASFFCLGDFQFDLGKGRHLLTVAGMQMVDNKFLYFKTFVLPTRKPLKVDP